MAGKGNPGERRNLKIIAIICIANLLISGYLLYTKFSGYKSFCDFSPELSCDAVSQSPYSELPANSGIPVAGLGIIAFIIFLTPTILLLRNPGNGKIILGLGRRKVHQLMALWGAFSILFYLYLTYLEIYVIYAICPLCVVTFALTIVMFFFILHNMKMSSKGGNE